MSVISGLLLYVVKTNLDNGSLFDYSVILIISGNLLFATLNQVSLPALNTLGYRRSFMSLTLATHSLSLVLAVSFVKLFSPTAEFWLSGLLIGQATIGLLGTLIFDNSLNKIHLDRKFQISMLKIESLFRYSWPVCISAVCFWIQGQSYRYQMEQFLGLKELGLFFSGYLISTGIIAGFDSIITAFFQPIFYKELTEKGKQQNAWYNYARISVPSLLLTGFFITSLAPELTIIILGPDYQAAAIYIVFGAFAEMARVVSGVYGLAAHASMDTKKLIMPNIISAITCIFLVSLLTPIFRSDGVGYALVISSFIFLALSAYYAKKIYNITLKTVDIKYSITAGVLMLLCSELFRFLMTGYHGLIVIFSTLLVTSIYFIIVQFKILGIKIDKFKC